MKYLPSLRSFYIVLVILLSSTPTMAANNAVIPREEIEGMFENIRTKTPDWNIEGNMLWGYFFTDTNPTKLEPLKQHLIGQGYHFVDLYPADDNPTYFLHVEKIEHHTTESLYQRNIVFYNLAEQYLIESYDGMDVGPIGK
jgi:hypothetical protein